MPASKAVSFGFADMTVPRHDKRVEFGDFQTPPDLARAIFSLLSQRIAPASILEPTCGIGSFLVSGAQIFPEAQALGVEINPLYVAELEQIISNDPRLSHIRVINDSFFAIDWTTVSASLPQPVLIIGNPPWVTNAAVGALGGSNLPTKSNFQAHAGLDALTGKSNFDISEWMIRRLLDVFMSSECTIGVLCKTAVARKILLYSWSTDVPLHRAEIRRIDAVAHFGASVEACLLVLEIGSADAKKCLMYDRLDDATPSGALAYRNGQLIANVDAHERWKHLEGASPERWRSGVKHDCSKVMEMHSCERGLLNGF